MNKNISEETIEISGKEYKLFLNRTGIINWERMTQATEKASKYKDIANITSNEIEITDDMNPFEAYGDIEEKLDSALNEVRDIYAKFYWIALYTHNKLSLSEATKLFDTAVEEYGIEQLIQLANQMLENANQDMIGENKKNLKALKSTN